MACLVDIERPSACGSVKHRFKVGDQVVFTNIFGVCWGVRTVTGLDERNGPTYFLAPTETPWFSTGEKHLTPADDVDLAMSAQKPEDAWAYFQNKYGFIPTETYGCW